MRKTLLKGTRHTQMARNKIKLNNTHQRDIHAITCEYIFQVYDSTNETGRLNNSNKH